MSLSKSKRWYSNNCFQFSFVFQFTPVEDLVPYKQPFIFLLINERAQ
jgi:hypothetical protein